MANGMVTTGELEYAKRKALENFDRWVDCTGFIQRHTSYYYELSGLIEDAVDMGCKVACDIEINLEDYE